MDLEFGIAVFMIVTSYPSKTLNLVPIFFVVICIHHKIKVRAEIKFVEKVLLNGVSLVL